jgi:hypothetical protein
MLRLPYRAEHHPHCKKIASLAAATLAIDCNAKKLGNSK